jgi:hypothetical protein
MICFISSFTLIYFDSFFIKTGLFFIIISLFYLKDLRQIIFKKNKENNEINNKENKLCNYLAKANLIIDSDANKIFDILSDIKIRREWDNFIRQPEDIIEISKNTGLEVF